MFLWVWWYSGSREPTFELVVQERHHQRLAAALHSVPAGVVGADRIVAVDLRLALGAEAREQVEGVVREEALAVERLGWREGSVQSSEALGWRSGFLNILYS